MRTSPDGAFTVRSTKPAPPTFTLSASLHPRVPAQIEIAEGATGLELVLAPGGKLTARIVAEGVSPMYLVGVIEAASGRRHEPNQAVGRFGADNLAAGRYAVVVRIAQSSWELLRIDGIDVPAGGMAKDARLDRIDVGPLCRTLRLRLVDANQAPLAEQRCEVRDAQGRGLVTTSGRDGRLHLAVPRAADRLTVSLEGDRRGTAVGQDAEQIVVIP